MKKQFDDVQTPEGVKTILRTHQDQIDFGTLVWEDSFYCLLPHAEGWIVEMVVDRSDEADEWFVKQKEARVYYGKSGNLRSAK